MSQYTNVSVVVPKSAPARDPKIQEGWDEAKLGPLFWNTCKEGFRAILRNAKNYDKSWKYPRNKKELPDTIDELASMCKEELDLHEKIHDRDWMSTTSVVMSSEIGSFVWMPLRRSISIGEGQRCVIQPGWIDWKSRDT